MVTLMIFTAGSGELWIAVGDGQQHVQAADDLAEHGVLPIQVRWPCA